MDSFTEWICKRGAYFPEVTMRKCDDNSGYGIFAKRTFRLNEILISIPREVLITARALTDMPCYKQIFDGEYLRPFEALIVFFILEKQMGKDSLWSPYLDVLPHSFATPAALDPDLSPDFLPVTERELWLDQQKELDTMFSKVSRALGKSLDYKTFLWAWHIVNSRCIYVPSDPHPMFDNSEGDSIAVIPFVDMLNHSNEYQGFCEWNNVMQRYVVTAARAIAEGEQIFVCYGPHSNGRLWIDYGFTMPNNLCNRIPLTLELLFVLAAECGVSLTEAHKQAVRDAKLSCTLYSSDEFPSYGYRAALRILQLRYDQLSKWSHYVYNDEEDTPEHERIVFLSLQTLLNHYLSKRTRVPEKYQWLWDEYIVILESYLENLKLKDSE